MVLLLKDAWWSGSSPQVHPSSLKKKESCMALCDPMDCSPPGSSAHGIFQARILEWIAIPFPTEGSNPDLPHCGQILYHLSHQGTPSASCLTLTKLPKEFLFPSRSWSQLLKNDKDQEEESAGLVSSGAKYWILPPSITQASTEWGKEHFLVRSHWNVQIVPEIHLLQLMLLVLLLQLSHFSHVWLYATP